MNAEKDLVVLGRFGRKHGIKGFISIQSFTEPRDNILDYTDWHVFIDNQWKVLKVLHIEVTNKHILAQIEGFDTREQVGKLTNLDLYASKEQLPVLEMGEYYWHELIGMEVIHQRNQRDESLGYIVEILATGANDVLVVKNPDKKQVLIPYLPDDTIIKIDTLQQKMWIRWDWDDLRG